MEKQDCTGVDPVPPVPPPRPTLAHVASQTDLADEADAAPAATSDQADALKIVPMISHLASLEQGKRKKEREREEKRLDERLQKGKSDALGGGEPLVHLASPQRTVRVLKPAIEEECYAMDYPKRGICLILEHDEFKPSLLLSDRRGSEVDLKATNETFSQMGFEVYTKRNLRYSEVGRLLEEVADMDHSNYDCFALVLLSHGNEGTVYAYDAAYPTQKLWEPFTSNRSPSLAGKPKMFFLQACQGARMDPGVRVTRATTATDSFASYKVPVHADFVIAHSTIAGYYSWRNTVAGSWYVQCLTRVMDTERGHRDLLSMLTLVNLKVTREYESSSSRPEFNNKKQTPFLYSTLTHKLYLVPKTVART